MKLSLFPVLASIAIVASACSEPSTGPTQDEPKPADSTTPPVNSSAPPRQLVTGKAIVTTPVNLLADPGFMLAGSQRGGYGSFLGYYETAARPFQLESTYDSRSPSGFGGNIALIRPDKATNEKSAAVIILTSFLGGQGPFHAKVWASKSNVDDQPVDLPTDGSAVRVSVTDGSPDGTGSAAFDLTVDPSATQTIAGRTWILFRADITKPLENGAFFLVRTGTKGGHIEIAAPEVMTDEITVGQAVKSRSATKIASPRALTVAEKSAIRAYRSIVPNLVPATPKPELAQ